MICLTGDVHHQSLNTKEASLIYPFSELQLAERYMKIADRYDLKVTLFITGKTFLEESNDDIQNILDYSNLEIGGHTYNAFKPYSLHRFFKMISGSYWLLSSYQKRDMLNTINIIRKYTELPVVSWRTHAYLFDKNTPDVLKECGLKVWSDIVDPHIYKPYRVNGVMVLPVNTPKDHTRIYHGYVTERYITDNKIYSKYYDVSQWFKIVKIEVEKIVNHNGVATLNVHPVCMYLADKFHTFKRLCKFLSQYESINARDTLKYLD